MQKEFEFVENLLLENLNTPLENLLIIDTETTGLDVDRDFCLEIGAILFNVRNRSVLSQVSFLLPVNENPAETINKIPSEITKIAQPYNEALQYFKALVERADVMLAHNAAFDKQWFGKGLLPEISKPWICSMEDISWPSDLRKNPPSVRDLALYHEVPVWSEHRALSDCIYIAEVLKRYKQNLEDLLSFALEPRKLMRAQVSYEDRHLAKNAGFRWNEPVRGAWTRRLSKREALKLDFPVIAIQ